MLVKDKAVTVLPLWLQQMRDFTRLIPDLIDHQLVRYIIRCEKHV